MSKRSVFDKEVNFLPKRIIDKRNQRKQLAILSILASITVIALLLPFFILKYRVGLDRPVLLDLERNVRNCLSNEGNLKQLETKKAGMEQARNSYKQLLDRDTHWSNTLKDIEAVLPEGIWLTSLRLEDVPVLSGKNNPKTSNEAKEIDQTIEELQAPTKEAMDKIATATGGASQNAKKAEVASKLPDKQTAGSSGVRKTSYIIQIEGRSKSVENVGMLVYKLKGLPCFKEVLLMSILSSGDEGNFAFKLSAYMKDNVNP